MDECGILNLASCLPERFFAYLVEILNAPIQPFLTLTKDLLSEPINISLFASLWVIIIYILSMFYAFLIIYSGFNFIISGYDAAKRENAKAWLRNVLIMIVLVQSSFFIYELAIELSSIMTSSVLILIDQDFFLLTIDNIPNIGLQLFFSFLYVASLLITTLVLIIRYAIVAIGVVLFPIAIFFYFIDPLKCYGSLIINFLAITIFVTFFDAIILIGFSKLIEIELFANFKALVMVSAFLIINLLMLFLMFFSIIKSASGVYDKVGSLAKFI